MEIYRLGGKRAHLTKTLYVTFAFFQTLQAKWYICMLNGLTFSCYRYPATYRVSSTHNERGPVPRSGNSQSSRDIPSGLQCFQARWRDQTFGEKLCRRNKGLASVFFNFPFSYSRTVGLDARLTTLSLFNDIPSHESPFQANSSSMYTDIYLSATLVLNTVVNQFSIEF